MDVILKAPLDKWTKTQSILFKIKTQVLISKGKSSTCGKIYTASPISMRL